MAKENKSKGNVPNLRFPGFDGEWKMKKLGDVIEFKAGYAFPSNRMLNEKSTYQLIKMSNVYRNELRLDRNPSFWDQVDTKQAEFLIKKGDTVLTLTGTVGKKDFGYSVQINEDDKYLLNQRLVLLREKEGKSVNGFISQVVSNKKFLSDFFETAKGGTGNQTNVGIESIKNLIFYFPVDSEQRKIADFLATIDLRIQTQNKIIEGLKVQMLGLQEQIFRRKIKLTDKKGDNFPEWELKTMKELFTFKITNSFSREQLNYENGLVKNIHYGDIHTKFHTLFDIQKEEVPYINTDVQIDRISEENYCAVGDMIFADASEDLIDVGKSIEIVNLNNQKLLAGLHTILARPINRSFAVGFCGYLFKSDGVKSQIQKESQGSKVLSISAVRLSKVSISIPCIDEQTKIVNFLSSIDAKINVENRLLDKLKEQKKFLLRQMFV